MLVQLLELYKLLDDNKSKFEERGLSANWFIDVYRSQPYQPELHEYFSLPALFVDYTMKGQGKGMPRLVTITLHIVTDEMPDASNISEQQTAGLNRFLYNLTLQEILEGCKLGNTKPLRFDSENSVDEQVTNYHTQSYDFEVDLSSMIGNPIAIFGEFERLNIYGSLTNQL